MFSKITKSLGFIFIILFVASLIGLVGKFETLVEGETLVDLKPGIVLALAFFSSSIFFFILNFIVDTDFRSYKSTIYEELDESTYVGKVYDKNSGTAYDVYLIEDMRGHERDIGVITAEYDSRKILWIGSWMDLTNKEIDFI